MTKSFRAPALAAALAVAGSGLALPLASPTRAEVAAQERVFFVQDVDGDGLSGLFWRDAAGGDDVTVVADTGTVDVYDLTSSADGSRIAYVMDTYSATSDEPLREKLVVRDASAGSTTARTVEDLDQVDGTLGVQTPVLSPDGGTLLYARYDWDAETTLTRKVAVGSGAPVTLANGYEPGAVLPNGTVLLQDPDASAWASVPLTGGTPVAAPGIPDDVYQLTVAPNGTDVVYTSFVEFPTSTIKRGTLDGTTLTPGITLSGATGLNMEPTWSQDLSSVRYVRYDSETEAGDLATADADTAGSGVVTATGADEYDVAVAHTDAVGPQAPTMQPATLSGTSATIRWALPTDGDLSGVLLTRTGKPGVFVRAPLTSYTDTGLALGSTYTYSAVAYDRSGNASGTATRQLTALSAAPLVYDPTSATSTRASFPVTFGGAASGGTYTVDYLKTGASAWVRWATSVPTRTGTFGSGASGGFAATTSIPGATYAFRVRAADAFGNSTALTVGATKAVVPFDHTKASFSGGTQYASSTAYLGSYRKLTTAAQYAKVTLVGNRLQIIGMKCAACGSFTVYDGATKVATVSSYLSTTKVRQVLYARAYSSSGTHTFLIRPVGTAGHPAVVLDGFAMRR